MRFIKHLVGKFGKILRTKFGIIFPYSIYRFLNFSEPFSFEVNNKEIIIHPLCEVSNHIFYSGIYGNFEGHSLKIWNHLCISLRDSYVFDIGGYSGIYSLVAASANKEIKVHAFEPHPNTFKILQKNISLNSFKNIFINNFAVDLFDGDITFYNSKGHAPSGFSSVNHKFIAKDSGTLVCTAKDIRVLLKNIYSDKKISLMKIDIERAELPILNEIISRILVDNAYVLCEILDEENYKKFDSLFFKNGYRAILIDDINKKAIEVNQLENVKQIGRNILFIPKLADSKSIINLE